ncbi:hypothetical protein T03_12838 [Trichinella britovi]|uniref:Uncharacterized protein n=1 Tax=Trichinella britovi TaxID=45882 RepID=A0A0V0YY01_TRIBR|nr:hypothetical protein T03_12838 [Trichinella britovi]
MMHFISLAESSMIAQNATTVRTGMDIIHCSLIDHRYVWRKIFLNM